MQTEKDQIRRQWNYAAECWNDFVESRKDAGKKIIVPGIVKLLPEKRTMKERALDLCCGEGYYSRLLRDKGYDAYGVDISDEFVRIAKEKDKDVTYCCTDAAQMEDFGDGFFDLVVCSMGLIDTPDLNGTLREVERVLKPGRYFVASITHPCFDRPMVGTWMRDDQGKKLGFTIDNYSDEKGMTFKWKMQKLKYSFETLTYHRTLSTYFNCLIRHTLSIDEIAEPSETMDGKIDEEEFRVPNFLIIRCRKESRRGAEA